MSSFGFNVLKDRQQTQPHHNRNLMLTVMCFENKTSSIISLRRFGHAEHLSALPRASEEFVLIVILVYPPF